MSLQRIFPAISAIHLMQHKSLEMVLLKGHLLLEIAMDNGVQQIVTKDEFKRYEELSFHRKLKFLEKLQPLLQASLGRALAHLLELNCIRNRFAHEIFFRDGVESIESWSAGVLKDFPALATKRRSSRMTFIEAISAIGCILVDPLSDFALEVAGARQND